MKKIVLYTLVSFGLIGCSGGGSDDSVGNGGGNNRGETEVTAPKPFSVPMLSFSDKTAYLEAMNNARMKEQYCGSEGIKPAVPSLTWNDDLYTAAAEHSTDMAAWNNGVTDQIEARKRFSHDGSATASDWTYLEQSLTEGSTFRQRIDNSGYKWTNIGENLTVGTSTDTAVEAVEAWLNSPPHCVNLMSANFTQVGMALVIDADSFYTHYWTQNFGNPR